MLITWSTMTALCGMAQNYAQLLAARIGVGAGEAGCTPPSHSLISDSYPLAQRSQALAFYGMGDFHQILRENITFEIRDISARQLSNDVEIALLSDFDQTAGDTVAHLDDAVQSDRFTNLREALKFFEQIKDAEKLADGDIKESASLSDRDIPPNTIDRQFVDVLTYHEQKQQRLREALKG